MITNENSLSIEQKSNDKFQIIYISGNLEYQNMNIARDMIKELMEVRECYILNFSKTTKIDSTGFGLVFSIIRENPDAKIFAVVEDPFITELFKITKVDQIIPIYSSEDLAIKDLDVN